MIQATMKTKTKKSLKKRPYKRVIIFAPFKRG